MAAMKAVLASPVSVNSRQDIESKLSAIPKRDLNKPADGGILFLPVDICLGVAPSSAAAAATLD